MKVGRYYVIQFFVESTSMWIYGHVVHRPGMVGVWVRGRSGEERKGRMRWTERKVNGREEGVMSRNM
jgi:hypothetical protein